MYTMYMHIETYACYSDQIWMINNEWKKKEQNENRTVQKTKKNKKNTTITWLISETVKHLM